MNTSHTQEALTTLQEEKAHQQMVIRELKKALKQAQGGLEAAVKRAIKSDTGNGCPVNATAEYSALVKVKKILSRFSNE